MDTDTQDLLRALEELKREHIEPTLPNVQARIATFWPDVKSPYEDRRVQRALDKLIDPLEGDMGKIHLCPYCVIEGQHRPLIPQSSGKTFSCGGCGHETQPDNPSFVCTCDPCTRASGAGKRQ